MPVNMRRILEPAAATWKRNLGNALFATSEGRPQPWLIAKPQSPQS